MLLFIQIAICLQWNEEIDVHVFHLANPWLYFVKSLNGTAIIILLAQMIHLKLLVFIGGKTKELMILHYPPFYYTVILRFLLGKVFNPNIVGLVVITVVTIVCCLTIDKMMGRLKIWKIVMGR